MADRKSTKPATKFLLELLAQAGRAPLDFFVFLHDLKYHRAAYARGGHALVEEFKRLKDQRTALRTLTVLSHSRYLTVHRIGRRLMVTLTTKGVAATLASHLRQAPKRSDGAYTVVIFDVPESQHLARRQFRLLLRQGGFIKLQQSVWVSERDVYDMVVEFVEQVKWQPWVNVFYSSHFWRWPR